MEEDKKDAVAGDQFLTTYRKDYIKRKIMKLKPCTGEQEFKDPINEGFRNYLEIDQDTSQPFGEDGDIYLEKVKDKRKKIGKMYFELPLDHVTIKGNKLLDGKSVYQVDYCDIEADIRQKLTSKTVHTSVLPEGWVIPLTTQKYDFRPPLILSEHAMDPVMPFRPGDNLGQNEKVNKILNVKTGDSEYNNIIGKLGEFIVNEQMHGKIIHLDCTCLQHNPKK